MLKKGLIGFLTGLFVFIIFIAVTLYFTTKQVNKVVNQMEEDAKEVAFIKSLTSNEKINITSVFNNEKDSILFNTKKPIFINFWSTSCRPCISEMGDIQKLYEKKKDKVDFYIISTEAPKTVARFLKNKSWDLPFYTSSDSIKFLNHQAIPRTYIIKDRIIYLSHLGKNDWNQQKVINFLKGLE